jgi:uncharacterized protein (DUF2141 family)
MEGRLMNKGVVLTQDMFVTGEVSRPTGPPTRWQENHGNLLLIVVAIIFAVGACVLIYRQNRFVPPRFPESSMIAAPPKPADKLLSVAAKDSFTIRVLGAANETGTVKIAIYESESSFNNPDDALLSESVMILDSEATWTVPVRPPDKLAIVAYHDENDDNELNRNRLGFPTERYGFSKNVRGATGLPGFQETVIDRPKPGETINIFIR